MNELALVDIKQLGDFIQIVLVFSFFDDLQYTNKTADKHNMTRLTSSISAR